GRDRAAAPDQDARQRALRAAEDRANHGADAGTRADLPGFALDAFALERIGDGCADRIRTAADGQTIEGDRQLAGPFDASGLRDRAHYAAHHRAGGYHHAVSLLQVDHRGCFEAIFDLRRRRTERARQPHVEFRADRDIGVALRP